MAEIKEFNHKQNNCPKCNNTVIRRWISGDCRCSACDCVWSEHKTIKVELADLNQVVAGVSCDDPILQPAYYGGKADPYEVFKIIRAWQLDFFMGNVLKYIRRAGKKDSKLAAYRKAREYLDDEIRMLEATEAKASSANS